MTSSFSFRLGLMLLLCISGLLVAYADESTEELAPEEGSADYACGQAMLEQGGDLVSGYETFLNEFFQVDTPSSGQFEDALTEYRFIEMSIWGVYQSNVNIAQAGSDGKTLDQVNDELNYCQYVRDSYLGYIQSLFQRQMLGSTASKVTFKVVDGLKVMNADLDSLADDFGKTFPGLFDQMNNALPCYARSCVTR